MGTVWQASKDGGVFLFFSTIAPYPASTGLLLIITLYLLIARVNPFRNKIPATLAESG
jgi:hypothetical protein